MPNGCHAQSIAAATGLFEAVFALTGESMSPTLERG